MNISNKKKGREEQKKKNDEAGQPEAGHLHFSVSVASFGFGPHQRFLI